jgi:hypothetical protein
VTSRVEFRKRPACRAAAGSAVRGSRESSWFIPDFNVPRIRWSRLDADISYEIYDMLTRGYGNALKAWI